MRLIDADEFIEYIKGTPLSENAKGTIYNLIANQPTAYDVEKVVEKIYKEQEKEFIANEVPIGCIGCAEVVEIVKEGGVNES